MPTTMNDRNEFLITCFADIKEQIKRGPNKKYEDLYKKVIENGWKRKTKLGNLPQFPHWTQDVNDHDVYDAINTLHMICDTCMDKTASDAINHTVGIACGRILPTNVLSNEGATNKAEHIIRRILECFGQNVDAYVQEGSINDMIKLIYRPLVDRLVDRNGRENPIKYSCNLLHFNRLVRNSKGHDIVMNEADRKYFGKPQVQRDVSVFWLYNFITIVYILKYVVEAKFSDDFAQYYKEHVGDFYTPVIIGKDAQDRTLSLYKLLCLQPLAHQPQ